MKPALSVVFFTVASGAGLGVLAIVGVCALFDLPWLLPESLPKAGATGLGLVLLGLGASTLHLANPRNAWRSYSRFRTSWLSREAVFALALVLVTVAFVALVMSGSERALWKVLAVLMIALSWIVLLCTAMIYASLKPIRQWHTRWTPIAYFVLGHWSGALIVLALARYDASNSVRLAHLCLALAVLSALVKWAYWRSIRIGDAATLEQAIGVAQGVRPPTANVETKSVMQARLLDAGHTGRTFLTDEFVFRLARAKRAWLLAVFWLAGIVLPLAWVIGAWWQTPIVVGACLLNLIGLLAERAVFFADARHTVRLYHGEPRA